MAVADTSFFVDLLADEAGAVNKLDELVEVGEPLWTPTIALHELFYGARLHEHSEREVERIREVQAALPPLEFTAEAARIAGRLEAEMEKDGARPGRADVQIAATALAHGDAVLTRDARFEAIEGLRVERY